MFVEEDVLSEPVPTAAAHKTVRDAIAGLFANAAARFGTSAASGGDGGSARGGGGDQEAPGERVVYVGSGDGGGGSNKSRRWGCCTWVLVLVAGLALIVGATLVAISVSGAWATAQATGDGLAALVTRLASLQTHHEVWLLTDVYGDAVGAEAAATEFPPRELGAVIGSVDVHSRRVDWALTVYDPNARLTTVPLVALWVQRYNTTTNRLVHVPRSPFVLCRGMAMRASVLECTGTEQHPERLPSVTDGALPLQLSVVVFASETASAQHPSAPAWFIPFSSQ